MSFNRTTERQFVSILRQEENTFILKEIQGISFNQFLLTIAVALKYHLVFTKC